MLDYTIENGHWEVLKELLSDSRVTLEANTLISKSRHPLMNALQNQHWDIVLTLLKHPSIDPTIGEYSVLREAYKCNKVDVAYALLSHPKVDPNRIMDFVDSDATGWSFMSNLEDVAGANPQGKKVSEIARRWRDHFVRK